MTRKNEWKTEEWSRNENCKRLWSWSMKSQREIFLSDAAWSRIRNTPLSFLWWHKWRLRSATITACHQRLVSFNVFSILYIWESLLIILWQHPRTRLSKGMVLRSPSRKTGEVYIWNNAACSSIEAHVSILSVNSMIMLIEIRLLLGFPQARFIVL